MTPSTYRRAHSALRRARGSAVGQPCAHPDCDRPSTGWALVGHPTHFGYNAGIVVRWSVRLEDYVPACARHNAQADHGGTWLMCRRGHVRAVWGTDSKGDCRGCVRHRDRERAARFKTSRRLAGTTPTPVGIDREESA